MTGMKWYSNELWGWGWGEYPAQVLGSALRKSVAKLGTAWNVAGPPRMAQVHHPPPQAGLLMDLPSSTSPALTPAHLVSHTCCIWPTLPGCCRPKVWQREAITHPCASLSCSWVHKGLLLAQWALWITLSALSGKNWILRQNFWPVIVPLTIWSAIYSCCVSGSQILYYSG